MNYNKVLSCAFEWSPFLLKLLYGLKIVRCSFSKHLFYALFQCLLWNFSFIVDQLHVHTELKMPIQGPQWTEFLSCEVCYKLFSEKANRPISLGCGHTVCKMCLSRLQQSKCPFDQSPITCDIDKLPVNYALLQLVGAAIPDKLIDKDDSVGDLFDARKAEYYESARKCIEELAVYLKPLSEGK